MRVKIYSELVGNYKNCRIKSLQGNKLKTFLTAIFCCCRAILYPGSRIIVASGNRGQSALIITDKIETLRKQYPALDKEIEKVQKNNDNIRCIFKNGSIIEAIVSGDGARG